MLRGHSYRLSCSQTRKARAKRKDSFGIGGINFTSLVLDKRTNSITRVEYFSMWCLKIIANFVQCQNMMIVNNINSQSLIRHKNAKMADSSMHLCCFFQFFILFSIFRSAFFILWRIVTQRARLQNGMRDAGYTYRQKKHRWLRVFFNKYFCR